jgi:hypothetical protein
MFGVFPFGAPYFGDAINIDHGAAQPHVINAFGRYEAFVSGFGRYQETLDTFGRFEEVLDTFGNEGEV